MKVKPIVSIETALRIFYTYPEIGNKQIHELFGKISPNTVVKYKKAVLDAQKDDNILTMQANTVNTETAFKVWGIDVEDLERRRTKLKKLGLIA